MKTPMQELIDEMNDFFQMKWNLKTLINNSENSLEV